MKKLLLIFLLVISVVLIKASSSNAQTSCPNVPTNTGTVTFTTTTPAGTYRVWSRMKSADTSNNSFYLRIDSNCAALVGDSSGISSSAWTWVDYQSGTTTNKINVTLSAGTHTVTLIGNEAGVAVDKILLTKDTACTPVNFGDNCPAETPTQTPTPTATQTSSTTVGPRATPSTPAGITVPSLIDKTGATDVTSALNSWINSQPSGTAANPTVLIFPAGATYLMNAGIQVNSKNYMTFWGYGSTLKPIGNGTTTANSGFRLQNSTNIKILGFRIKGSNIDAGTSKAYHTGQNEYSMGVALINNSDDVEIADNWISHVFGDGVYISYDPTGWPDRSNIHNNLIELTGRQGIVPDSGSGHIIQANIIRDSAMSAIDAEDARGANVPLDHLYIRNNLFDKWMWYGGYTCHAIPMDYAAGDISQMSDIYIENNTFQGGCMAPAGTAGAPTTQDADISMYGGQVKNNIFIRNNIFNLPSNQQTGWAVRLNSVTGGQVTGNAISGQTVQCQTCANVLTTPNNGPVGTATPTLGAQSTGPFSITSGPTVTNITNTGAIINWNLSDYSTGTVEYGKTTAYGTSSTPETSFTWNYHVQTLSGLTLGTLYHYRVKSTNKAGQQVVSGDFTFTTTGGTIVNTPTPTFTPTPTPKATPPVISAVSTNSVTQNTAKVTWTLNKPGTGQVEYGTSTSYGNVSVLESSFNYTTHVQTLSGLTAGTTYHYRVKSADQAGNLATSGDFTFATVAPTSTPTPTPVPCTVTGAIWETTTNPMDQGKIVTLKVTGSANCVGKKVDFHVRKNNFIIAGVLYNDAIVQPPTATIDSTGTARSTWTTEGDPTCTLLCLSPQYFFDANLSDNTSVTRRSDDPLLVINLADRTPPAISAVGANSITDNSAKVTWTLNEPATGQVEYGTSTQYGKTSTLESSFNYTTHVQTLSGLTAGTTYHYRVKSADQAGNQAVSSDFTFKTSGGIVTAPATGLQGTYFANTTFSGTPVSRTDATINFNWLLASPTTSLPSDNFSVRWTGYIVSPTTGSYTIYIKSDDGARVWVNNKLIINRWSDHSAKEYSAVVDLTKGIKNPIKVEYYEHLSAASVQLSWSASGVAKAIVPTSQLIPR